MLKRARSRRKSEVRGSWRKRWTRSRTMMRRKEQLEEERRKEELEEKRRKEELEEGRRKEE